MALTDKNIVITPNTGAAADPKLVFTAASASSGPQRITLTPYPISGGTLSFEGTAGQLFSITNSMSGTIFSANDVSGIPSIEVLDTGLVKLAQYSGNVAIGFAGIGTGKFQVQGSTWSNSTGTDVVIRNYNSVGSGITLVPLSSSSYSAGWSLYAGASGASIGDGAVGLWNHTTQNYSFYADQSNNTYSRGSSRAPIFYDSDNTGYYLDPASTTNLNVLYVAGQQVTGGASGMSSAKGYFFSSF